MDGTFRGVKARNAKVHYHNTSQSAIKQVTEGNSSKRVETLAIVRYLRHGKMGVAIRITMAESVCRWPSPLALHSLHVHVALFAPLSFCLLQSCMPITGFNGLLFTSATGAKFTCSPMRLHSRAIC